MAIKRAMAIRHDLKSGPKGDEFTKEAIIMRWAKYTGKSIYTAIFELILLNYRLVFSE